MFIIILGEKGVGHSFFIRELDDSHVGHVLAIAPRLFTSWTENFSLTQAPVNTVLRIHMYSLHIMKRKPCFH